MEQCVLALKGTQGTWQVLLIQRSHTSISEVRTEPTGCKALSAFADMLFKPLSCIGNVCVGSTLQSAESIQKAYHGQSTKPQPLQLHYRRPGMASLPLGWMGDTRCLYSARIACSLFGHAAGFVPPRICNKHLTPPQTEPGDVEMVQNPLQSFQPWKQNRLVLMDSQLEAIKKQGGGGKGISSSLITLWQMDQILGNYSQMRMLSSHEAESDLWGGKCWQP